MSDDHERTIVDSARYLKAVRPIDPEELAEYVGGALTADDVADILCDRATQLGLIERADGRFVAASSDPLAVDFAGVRALPAAIEGRIEASLVAAFGDDWASGRSGDRLREAIRGFKEAYFAGRRVEYDRTTAFGYAIYHVPPSFASVQYVLDELASPRMLSGSIRVLDVGAGVGGQALGLASYLPSSTLLEYTAIEPSDAAADLLERYLADRGRNVHVTVRRGGVEDVDIEEPYDLILCANVLSELDEPVAVLEELGSALAADGAIVAIEPADRRTSRDLRRIERETCGRTDLGVFGPTLRLWDGRTPTDDCWSFDVKPDLAIPSFQRALDEAPRGDPTGRSPATGEFVNVDVQFSYSILRSDGARRIRFRPHRSRHLPLAEASDRVTDRVDVAVVKLSHSLADDEGGNDLFVIGDGSQGHRWFAVISSESALNRPLDAARYGDILLIERGLVLWNDDEDAFNLVVDEETIVDRIAPPDRALE